MKNIVKSSLLMLLMYYSFSANATLINLGGGLIYDDYLDLTWLSDANYAKTSGYDDDGAMSWQASMDWADSLTYAGFDGWRLPIAVNQDGSATCTHPTACTDRSPVLCRPEWNPGLIHIRQSGLRPWPVYQYYYFSRNWRLEL